MEEIWKDIDGYIGRYQISNLGRVKSILRFSKGIKVKILKYKIDKYGYLRVTLSKDNQQKIFFVHRLVAKAFIPNPENKPQVNHIDGNKQNNKVNNLEWVTNQENVIHAHITGLIQADKIVKNLHQYSATGSENPKSKAVDQFSLDGKFIKRWDSINQIERELGYFTQNICCCCQGKYKTAFKYIWKYA